ncbi:hypothetical protein R2F25_17170 [Streptomyces sp. UP1A-1]|nr:hypothetical protein [Streptomyces sp. UP1A-1]
MADEVVGHLTEVLTGEDGVLELFERLRVHLLDRGDEFVETYGGRDARVRRHVSTVGCARGTVNRWLTVPRDSGGRGTIAG